LGGTYRAQLPGGGKGECCSLLKKTEWGGLDWVHSTPGDNLL
jgi:hypothetical protein